MSNKENTAESVDKNKTEQATPAAAPDLSIGDLQSLKSIIDVASQRGAFKPNEMAVVGTTYNKLDSFLNAVATQQTAAKGE
tara:strand:- start:40158 stop:40400 length:243 start_codon:yes stop_codon:yes gene_type:complete